MAVLWAVRLVLKWAALSVGKKAVLKAALKDSKRADPTVAWWGLQTADLKAGLLELKMVV